MSAIESELKKISRETCPSGGVHEPGVEKMEEYPNGTVKYIIACRKCKAHFEVEL